MKSAFQIQIVFLLLISRPEFCQDTTSIIKSNWNNLKTVLKNRSEIISIMTNTIANSKKVDKNELNKTKSLTIELFAYIDTLSQFDSLSISAMWVKNNNLTKSIGKTSATIENDVKLKKKSAISLQIAQLEFMENEIALKKMEYNQVCKMYNKTELLFVGIDEDKKAVNIKF